MLDFENIKGISRHCVWETTAVEGNAHTVMEVNR